MTAKLLLALICTIFVLTGSSFNPAGAAHTPFHPRQQLRAAAPPLVERPESRPEIAGYTPDQIQQADLAAQESMAASTAELARLTWIQIFMAVAGTAALLLTLEFNRRTLRHAETTSREQLRAYIQIKAYEDPAEVQTPGELHFQWFRVIFNITNHGQTPARQVHFQNAVGFFDKPSWQYPDQTNLGAPIPLADLQPGFTNTAFIHFEGPILANFEPVFNRQKRVVIWIELEYSDVFGRRFRSRYSSALSGYPLRIENDNAAFRGETRIG